MVIFVITAEEDLTEPEVDYIKQYNNQLINKNEPPLQSYYQNQQPQGIQSRTIS